MSSNQIPIKTFAAQGVQASIFENERDGQRHCVIRITRRYTDTQGIHHTDRFYERDLASVELVARAARHYLTLKTFTPRGGDDATSSDP